MRKIIFSPTPAVVGLSNAPRLPCSRLSDISLESSQAENGNGNVEFWQVLLRSLSTRADLMKAKYSTCLGLDGI